VTGPKVKVGDKRLVLAQSAKISGQEISIDRSNRELSGTVVATKMIDIRGEESVFARVRTRQGKTFMVDLGRTAPLAIGLSEGTELTVTGPAAEIQERKILIAHSLTIDGQTRRINRSRG
jgi:hypothetical protein